MRQVPRVAHPDVTSSRASSKWSTNSLSRAPLPMRSMAAAADWHGSKSMAMIASCAPLAGSCGVCLAILARYSWRGTSRRTPAGADLQVVRRGRVVWIS
eukprot:scaffold2782_cov29-Tisochrysis_lutea.AAC.2